MVLRRWNVSPYFLYVGIRESLSMFWVLKNVRMQKQRKGKVTKEAPFLKERGTSLRLVDSWYHYVRVMESMLMFWVLKKRKNTKALKKEDRRKPSSLEREGEWRQGLVVIGCKSIEYEIFDFNNIDSPVCARHRWKVECYMWINGNNGNMLLYSSSPLAYSKLKTIF